MSLSIPKTDKSQRIEIFIVNLIVLLYLGRTAMPFLKYPFIVLFIGFLLYILLIYRKELRLELQKFLINYYLIIILGLVLIISFLLSDKIYLTVFKDIFNSIVLLGLFLFIQIVVTSEIRVNFFVESFKYTVIFFSCVFAFSIILELFSILPEKDNSTINDILGNATEYSSKVDYNFALLPIFFAIISSLSLLQITKHSFARIIFNVLLLLFSFGILLSGSRRGLIIFSVLLLTLIIGRITVIIRKDFFLARFFKQSTFYLISIFILFISLNVFFLNTSAGFKNKLLKNLGTGNVLYAKIKTCSKIQRYASIVNIDLSFPALYKILWSEELFDPNEPESGWGSRIHTTIFPLYGRNVEIVPKSAKGYLMNSTCNPSYNLNYPCESFSLLVNLHVKRGERYSASVYCFVSDDFDGDYVGFGLGSICINQKIVSGNTMSEYNRAKSGEWQKLEIDFECQDGEAPIYMSFTKNGVKDFSNLEGFVIFAYPTFQKKEGDNSSTPLSFGQNSEILYKNSYKSSLNPLSVLPVFLGPKIINEKDFLRNFISKLVSEDTVYKPLKTKLILNNASDQLEADRLIRWQFAWQIFNKEFNWKQKLFGGGFNFLNWYGYYFLKDKTKSDWPHNPFLSVLLYSGLLGLAFYSFFVYKVFYYYIKYIKEYPLLFIFFIITFFFSFFSGGSPFDPPVMGFFNILPFFIHAVHKRKTRNDKS
jgi:hypothetical protein